MRLSKTLIISLVAFVPCIITADEPSAAPSYLACHVNLHIKNVPTCTDQKQPSNHPLFWRAEVCQPKECLLRVYEIAHASSYVYEHNPPCGPNVSEYTAEAVRQFTEAYTKNPQAAKELTGRLAGPLTKAASDLLRHTNGFGDIGRYVISPYQNNNSVCVPVIATLPQGARLKRYALGASDTDQDDSNGTGICYGNPSCEPRPWSKFEDFRTTSGGPKTPTVVSVVFKNWRHDKGRRAMLVLWFTPPANKKVILRTQ